METYKISNGTLTVEIESLGAQLKSIKKDGVEYLWQGDERYWADRALNIFPYVARLYGGRYMLDGKEYNMNIHGFAWTSEFAVYNIENGSVTFLLSDSKETLKSYPRRFDFYITYFLAENTINILYKVVNKDDKVMYFGLGGHPGFNLPLEKGRAFEDYSISFDKECYPVRIGFTPDCFLNGEDIPYPLKDNRIAMCHDLFDDDAIVLKNMSRKVILEGGKRSVTVDFPQMPYLGIWHAPKTDAPYVCIEPWCSLPAFYGKTAVFEEQKDLLSLNPGDEYENLWSITLN